MALSTFAVNEPEIAARRLVKRRYHTPHSDLEHSLYAHQRGIDCANDDCTFPACQQTICDDCHRVLALLYASAFCGSRAEYRPILNWIMDPEYLA